MVRPPRSLMDAHGLFLIAYPVGVLALGLGIYWLTRDTEERAAPKR